MQLLCIIRPITSNGYNDKQVVIEFSSSFMKISLEICESRSRVIAGMIR